MDKLRPLAELTARLGEQVKEKKVTAVKSEVEQFGTVTEYLAGLEQILSGDLNGKELRYWIDSTAVVLGKNLAKESLATTEGRSIAEGIDELVATEQEIADNNEVLQKTADAAGVSVEELLGDRDSEIAQAVTRLREEKAAQVTELRATLQAYALELVHTLQEGNQRKLAMTKDELAEWEAKFAAVEALPQDYASYAGRLRQEFIATKHEAAESADRYGEVLNGLKERSNAVREKIWGDYTQNIVDTLARELPGDENEEKRRHLLAGLLRKGDDVLLNIRFNDNGNALIIRDELMNALPEAAVLDIARRGTIASLLSSFKLERSVEQREKNKAAYTNCIKTLTALDEKDTWARATFDDGTFISGNRVFETSVPGEALKKQTERVKEKTGKEIALANEVDAVIKFLYEGLDRSGRDTVTGGQNDHRILSPVWRTLRNNPPEFSPAIPAPATPDGVFYSQMDAPAASRVATQQATGEARTFMQGLSNALNKEKLQHERRVVTPSDVEAKNNSRVLAAEQQALAAMNEGAEGKKAIERTRAEKVEAERRLQQELETSNRQLAAALERVRTLDAELAQARDYARRQIETLTQDNARLVAEGEAQGRKVTAAEKKAADASTATSTLLEEMREAIEKPAGFLGGGLKEAIKAILEKSQPKKQR